MRENVIKLFGLSGKKKRMILGLMSGTSLDGLDLALCEIKEHGLQTQVSVIHFATLPYEHNFKETLLRFTTQPTVDLKTICLINKNIGLLHARMINDCLKNWKVSPEEVDLIASHGQTVHHAPAAKDDDGNLINATLQLGDADHIAVSTGIITVADFRQKHVAAGGEGAPLACYGDFLLFSEKDHDVLLINIGGISNFTYLPAANNFSKIVCSDTGPGNTLMDAYIRNYFPGKYFDEDSTLATQGTVQQLLLEALLDNSFFKKSFPKSTGPEIFNLAYLQNAMERCGNNYALPQEILATLNAFTAITLSSAIAALNIKVNKSKIYISGGGKRNPLLMANVAALNPGMHFLSTLEKGIHPDAKEAVLFAILANECIAGDENAFGRGAKGHPPISMGKISFPL